jgi:nitroreductase
VDTFLAIASKRDTRRYADRPVPEDVQRRILDAGRLAGSAKNGQPWRFVVVESAEVKERLAATVYAPGNVSGAQLVVAIVTSASGGMDIGRCMQNMMLTAWNEGVVSCPNGMPEAAKTGEVLGLEGEERPAVVLSFGYPVTPRDPQRLTAEEWSARADRKRLDEVVERR